MKKYLVIHPLLFAVVPVLFLYAHNIIETPTAHFLIPLGASIILAVVLWALLYLILRDIRKAGLATTIFLLFFFFYGRVYAVLEYLNIFIPRHAYFLPTVLLVFGYSVYFIKLTRRDFRTTTMLLNVVAVVLILLNVFNIASYQIRSALSSPTSPDESGYITTDPEDTEKQKNMPDIYVIIPDEYAHPDTMREYYDYDFSDFVNSLTEKGFFIAHGTINRNISTERSVASLLNMEYVSDSVPMETSIQRIANSKVMEFLKSKGYKIANFVSMQWGIDADYNLYSDFYEPPLNSAVTSDFMRIMCNTTMLRPFYDYLSQSQYESFYRRRVTDALDHLKKIPEVEGPKFILTHLYCPHDPFVFGAKGESVDAANWLNWEDKQFYLGQYIFISREIEVAIDVLLEKSQVPPIIIIQSDHGIRPAHAGVNISGDEYKKIFNAYHLPSGGTELLYDSISPVNSFRIIFNYYFNASYDLLED